MIQTYECSHFIIVIPTPLFKVFPSPVIILLLGVAGQLSDRQLGQGGVGQAGGRGAEGGGQGGGAQVGRGDPQVVVEVGQVTVTCQEVAW